MDQADDLLVPVDGGDAGVGEHGGLGLVQGGVDEVVHVVAEGLAALGQGGGRPGGEEAGQEGGHGDVRVEVDTQHGDHSSVVPQNGNGGGLEQGAVLIVEVHLGLGLLLLLQVPQQVQPKVGDGGAGLAVGVVPVDDLYHGVTQVLQAVEDKFIALPQVQRQTVHGRGAGFQNFSFGGAERKMICHRA